MNILGLFLLWFVNVLTTFLGRIFFNGEFSTEAIENSINSIGDIYNIFAWVDVFVPVDFLILLAALTAAFYGFKFVNALVKYVVALFK